MDSNHIPDDPILDALRDLRRYDVSSARAQRLRDRCHRTLQAQRASPAQADVEARRPRRAVWMLAAAWCCVYLLETIRRAVSVYGP
jgi:hypothetical protein